MPWVECIDPVTKCFLSKEELQKKFEQININKNSTADFELPPVFGDNPYTTKPIFLVFLSVILISVFFIAASRKAAIVPSKLQFAGESIYSFCQTA